MKDKSTKLFNLCHNANLFAMIISYQTNFVSYNLTIPIKERKDEEWKEDGSVDTNLGWWNYTRWRSI